MGFNLLKDGKSPSSETLLPVDAREKTAAGIQPTTIDHQQHPDSTRKMTNARRTTMIMLVCMLAFLGVASTRMPCHGRATNHKALEAVRRSDAPLGGSILQLVKRDDNSTSEGPSSTPPDSETGTETETETETEAPTSDSSTETPPPSTTNVPPTSTPTSVRPSSSSSAPPPTSNTPSSTPTPTPSSSLPETTLTTSTKPPASTTSPRPTSRQTTETITSTSPNGAVVIVTRTNYVPAGDETPAPTSTGSTPSLQNAAVGHRSGTSTVAGIVGFAMLLLMI
ncbi:hypothetical protein CHGG_07231 [Chaetomium globosum CBS 148.51]|uniref:Uncharacterized protein n=1 Tax=Chaetomium globosum (strain ATCC 6205 / CBS 148.51 / DSM 1962 / NBRC 6347 / NRRL 1970) TaxID=306901 RepID=Q2GXS3_CHAGB|nr:uncharacterized protein CHGG_07231 [Chaetomium globosum CBS 148.51]EAQ85978.1 hypothetical protein CHGG_07231 [Chaetomium globosum CBS 148.51]